MTSLVKEKVLTDQARDETLNQFRAAEGRLASARAAVQKARADRDRAEADERAAKAHVDVAAADARHAEALLGYARIRAPYDGVVTWRKVSTGDFVQPAGGQGDWLFRVARLDPVRVVVAVPEVDADLVREKAEVKLTVAVLPGASLSGTVARTSWALEPGARTLRAEIDLPNKDGRLRPGTYVSAQIVHPLPEAWVLPAPAVVKQGDVMVCFRIQEGKAVRTPVQVGRGDGQFTEILKWQQPGSPPVWTEFTGTEVVAARAAGLTDGQAVPPDSAGK
jgi:RND family efflux transporter MFP subunit